MSIIQVALLILLCIAIILYFKLLRTQTTDRMGAVAIFCLVFLAILFPSTTTALAIMVGVKRGADLILYFLCFACGYAFLILHSRISRQHRSLTELAREIALMRAKK